MQLPAPTLPDPESSAGRWDKIKLIVEQPYSPPSDIPGSTSSPPLTLLDASDMNTFGGTPLELAEGQNVIRCPDCSKPILESAVAAHAVNCQKIRERKLNGIGGLADPKSASLKRGISDTGSESSASPAKKPRNPSSLVVSLGDPKGSGADSGTDASSKPPKTKKKDKLPPSTNTSAAPTPPPITGSPSKDPAAKLTAGATVAKPPPRPGSVDVDKHCGVINDKGFPCSRSLTCKTHSMGAKRSVPHRSQPYDILLLEWQKATKGAEFLHRKPVQPRVGPGSEAYGAAVAEGKSGKRKKVDPGVVGGAAGAAGAGGVLVGGKERRTREKGKGLLIVGEWEESDPGEEEGLIDSDEEVESVLKGLNKIGHGKPLSLPAGGGGGFGTASLFAGRNSKLGRLREVLGGVFGTSGRPISGGTA